MTCPILGCVQDIAGEATCGLELYALVVHDDARIEDTVKLASVLAPLWPVWHERREPVKTDPITNQIWTLFSKDEQPHCLTMTDRGRSE